jgi:hypothetical protein
VLLPVIANNYRSPFFDDFSNAASGWPQGKNADYTAGYFEGPNRQGQYRMLFHTKRPLRTGRADLTAGDFQVGVDVQAAAQSNGAVGLIFGQTGAGYYTFETGSGTDSAGQPIGAFRFLAWTSHPGASATYESLVKDANGNAIEWAGSRDLKTGTQTNRIGVMRQGQSISLLANGVVIGTVSHPGFGVGAVDLAAWGWSADYDARFDNFRMAFSRADFQSAQSASVNSAGSSGILSMLLRLWANDDNQVKPLVPVTVSAPPVAINQSEIVPIEP